MSDIRLKVMPFEFNGKTYKLRANMNVLADVQEEYGGDFMAAINDTSPLRSSLSFLAAMLNDYADEMGWSERYTPRQLGRMLDFKAFDVAKVMKLVVSSIISEAPSDGDDGKN